MSTCNSGFGNFLWQSCELCLAELVVTVSEDSKPARDDWMMTTGDGFNSYGLLGLPIWTFETFIDVYFGRNLYSIDSWEEIVKRRLATSSNPKWHSEHVWLTEQSPVFDVEVWKYELLYFVYIGGSAFQVVHMVKINLKQKLFYYHFYHIHLASFVSNPKGATLITKHVPPAPTSMNRPF